MAVDDDINLAFQKLPTQLQPDGVAPAINAPVEIYQGDFDLHLQTETVPVNGSIYYAWRPKPGVRFRGMIDRYTFDFNVDTIRIKGKNLEHGLSLINHIGGSDSSIAGYINNPFIFHYENDANRLTFQLPNFREVLGMPVRNGEMMSLNRIELENENWLIRLDRRSVADQLKKDLKAEGGYGLTYLGEAVYKHGKFDYSISSKLVSDLGLFLTFLNGRRCYPCLIRGRMDDILAWEDFSSYHADGYKEEYSWLPQRYERDLSNLWQNFSTMIQNPEDRECLDFLVHWYVEANNNSGFAEGSIVFMQNAFELLYNWKIPAQPGKKIEAADKLRALLRNANIPLAVPSAYQRIVANLKTHGITIRDLPELFTRVRNAIVHSDNKKRKVLNFIPSMDRFHIRHLGLYCLELLILNVLDYQGRFANRVSLNKFVGGNEETVPWVQKV